MSIHPTLLAVLALAQALILAAPAEAEFRRTLAGPIEADPVRIIDGDTFVADAHVWPGHRIRVSIRIRDIDAPELRSRCEAERRAAEKARDRLAGLLGGGSVFLSNVGGGKFYGRMLADVHTAEGLDVAAELLSSTVVMAYDGGRREPYCRATG